MLAERQEKEPEFGEVAERPPQLVVSRRQQQGKRQNSKPAALRMLEQENLRKTVIDNYRKMRADKGAPTLVTGEQCIDDVRVSSVPTSTKC